MTASPAIDSRAIANEIKVRLSMRQMLEHLGAPIYSRKRAGCPIPTCRGNQKDTFSYSDTLGHCFRCNFGGDVFTLAQDVHGVKFRDALPYLADLAGVRLEKPQNATDAIRLRQEAEERRRISATAVKLQVIERGLRVKYRETIHNCERELRRASHRLQDLMNARADEQATSGYWAWLKVLWEMLQEALVGYSILAFGNARDRAWFTLRPDERHTMIGDAYMAGGFYDDDGHFIEVAL